MTEVERALADLCRTDGATEQVKIFAARELLRERRDLRTERRSRRLLWLLAFVGLANLINAALQFARLGVG